MKISIALSVLILALAVAFGWRDHQRLTSVRESHQKLVAEAAILGVSLEPDQSSHRIRITKHRRKNSEDDAKLAAAEIIAFAKEMEAMKETGEEPDEDTKKHMMEFMDRMISLSASQLKIVIAEVKNTPNLKNETRQGIIGFSIMTLSSSHPQAALTIFTESSDIFDKQGMGSHLISSSLSNWAKDDPLGALEWVRKNAKTHPKLVTDDTKGSILSGAARQNPKLAFELIDELKFDDSGSAIRSITDTARTAEELSTTLAALREHLATIPDDATRESMNNSAILSLASKAAEEGFETGSKWITESNFSSKELRTAAKNLPHSAKLNETGQWVEWLGDNLPAGKADNAIKSMVKRWTREDYQAAGTWLANTPDGPSKNTSIRSYAETVSRYDPETAAQWALTLPPGKDRTDTLKQIHDNWPKDDPADKEAAEAFREKHGIK